MSKIIKSILETPIAQFLGGETAPPIDLLNIRSEVVEYFMNNPPYYDEPKVYGFASLLNKPYHVKEYHKLVAPEIFIGFAGGASMDKSRALWKVIGESIERYALFMNNRISIKGSFEHLSKKKLNLLDPQKIFHSKKGNRSSNKQNVVIDWVTGYDLTNQTTCFLPTQLVAVPYWDSGDELIWRAPITTGAATGSSLTSAIFGGLCEVIERDAFMVSWLKQLMLKRIINYEKSILNSSQRYCALLYKTLQSIQRYNLQPEFYLLPNDTHLPTVMCILRDETKIGPPLTVGIDTDFSVIKTMLGALEESLQLRPWVRQLYENDKNELAKKRISFDITNLEQRALLWTKKSSVMKINNWVNKSETISLEKISNKVNTQTLGDLVQSISEKSTVYFTDLTKYTPKSVHKKKLFTVKVIIPEYQPLYLIERFADHVWERLSSAEKRLNSKSLMPKNALQKYPHPML